MSDFKQWWDSEGRALWPYSVDRAEMLAIELIFVAGEAAQAQKAVDQMAALLEDEV